MEKVYLETPEAVIKALKEGKEIKDEDGYSYKLVEGFIVCTNGNNFFVGDNITSIHNPYILEKEPFKIEIGKWYETRDHQKARCYQKVAGHFLFTIDDIGNFYTSYNGSHSFSNGLDIIGYWED